MENTYSYMMLPKTVIWVLSAPINMPVLVSDNSDNNRIYLVITESIEEMEEFCLENIPLEEILLFNQQDPLYIKETILEKFPGIKVSGLCFCHTPTDKQLYELILWESMTKVIPELN